MTDNNISFLGKNNKNNEHTISNNYVCNNTCNWR